MGAIPTDLTGPDLAAGVAIATLADGAMLHGHADGAHVLLVRDAGAFHAVGAHCTHYGVPLADGVVAHGEVRCPLHHACFTLATGAAVRAPAFDALARWRTEVRDGRVYVMEQLVAAPLVPRLDGAGRGMVIVGGGAAGNAAAEMLRREGYGGPITMVSAEPDSPPDRPNFSKGTIAGTVPHEYNFLRPLDFYREQGITLRRGTRVTAIDGAARTVQLDTGEVLPYNAVLLATGAVPVRLDVPGADLPHVHTVRSLADAEAIARDAAQSTSAVVIGASFIGMEVAAALRTRGLAVHVVAPDAIPMARVLGDVVGSLLRDIHVARGVTFHLGTTVTAITAHGVTLADGTAIDAGVVVMGVGVRPALDLAIAAGLEVDNGVVVDAQLATSVPGIFAAGDIARWPDARSGSSLRVEHWVVAERQGQVAARNMLGRREPFDAVPFFWTEQYDVTLLYVGHADPGAVATVHGTLDAQAPDCRVEYRQDGRVVAVATIGRDRESLEAELAFERLPPQ